MFGGGHKKIDVAGMVLAALSGFEASRNPQLAQMVNQNLMYRAKKRDADEQTAQYVQALVARGMNPDEAVIMAADPTEMAKHLGTHFDAATVDEGSSRYVPNMNGTANVFTAPKTFQHGADVVQMPGSQTVAPNFSSLGTMGVPQPLGDANSIPGLRTDAEQYAGSIATPGTPAYNTAIQDYTLKGEGPTAFDYKGQLQAARLANARTIAEGRNATSAANTRYRVDHQRPSAGTQPHPPTPSTVIGGIMDKQASGQPLTPAEVNTLRDYRQHYKPQRGAVQISGNEPVATDAHGNKLVVRNGQWVPAR
jgi:hypothetical protein